LFLNAVDLMPRGFALLAIQFRCTRASQPPLRAVHHRGHHLQIAYAQLQHLKFYKDAEDVGAEEMAAIASASTGELAAAVAAPACAEASRTAKVRSIRRD
jgi:hypothetical protein